MSIACQICKETLSLHNRVSLELPCQHEVCAQCVVASLPTETNIVELPTIECLVCKNTTRLGFLNKKALIDAQDSNKRPFICCKHKDEPILFISAESRQLLCKICLLEGSFDSKSLVQFRVGEAASLGKWLKSQFSKKVEKVQKSLASLGS